MNLNGLGDAANIIMAACAIVGALASLGGGYWMWKMKAQFAPLHEMQKHATDLANALARLKVVEDALGEEPDREQLSRNIERLAGDCRTLESEIRGLRNELKAEVAGVHTLVKGMGHQLDSIRDALLRGRAQ